MPYPPNIHKLVFGGPLPDEDEWQMSLHLRYEGGDLGNSETPRAFIKTALRDWWLDVNNGIGSNALLKWAKLNALSTSGRYANPYTNEWQLVNDNGPGLPPGRTQPGHPQLSAALTLRDLRGRGQASRGRVFPPCITFPANAGGKIAPADAAGAATAFATLIGKLYFQNDGRPVTPVIVSKGVRSNPNGLFSAITRVSVGDEIDVQQRRRTAAPEQYSVKEVPGAIPTDPGGVTPVSPP